MRIQFAATLAALVPLAAAHGFLSGPRSRNALAREQNLDYCPHCLNGGTVVTVQQHSIDGVWPYPETPQSAVRHGLCGDASLASGAQQHFMAGGQFASGEKTATWQAGSIVDVEFVMATHHRGHVEFSICDTTELADPNGPITQTCLNQHQLTIVDDPSDPSFIDANYPNRYYLPPLCAGSSPGTSQHTLYPDFPVYRARVQLPDNLECEHCVLQWYYVTANSCNPPGYRTAPWPSQFSDCEGDGPNLGWWGPSLGDCNPGYPEEFWNCADIEVMSGMVGPSPEEPDTHEPDIPQPTPEPTVGGACRGEWQQCAGSGMSGTACCASGLQCMRQSQYYSQCRTSCPSAWECNSGPNTSEPTSQQTPEPTPSVVNTPHPTQGDDSCTGPTFGEWQACTSGTGCCATGLQCMRKDQWYSQCRTDCPSGWECSLSGPSTPNPTPNTDSTPQPTQRPTPFSPTTAAPPGSNPWTLDTNVIMYNGQRVQLQGVAVTCLEYLLRGIGGECMTDYNWSDQANLITTPNQNQVDGLLNLLANPPSNVLSTVRFSLNAAYYLDVETPMWAENRARYPDLSRQYRTLLDNLVEVFTSRGLVVILDLHWNDDVTEQQAMALRDDGSGTTGDSVTFWSELALRYGNNPLVWYELYNEPFASSYTDWLDGGNGFEGMRPMYEAVRQHTQHPIVVAGQQNYAYDAESLVSFQQDVQPTGVVYNLHPYMGPYQAGDSSKNIDGYEQRVQRVLDGTGRPLIITEFGQYCCPADGACYLYPGSYDGDSMGFVEAVLTVNLKYDVSWTAWAWRPNSPGGGDCNQPDANDGNQLYDSSNYNGQGANWSVLFPQFFGVVTSS